MPQMRGPRPNPEEALDQRAALEECDLGPLPHPKAGVGAFLGEPPHNQLGHEG